jgi:hypothetical protein
VFQSGDEVWCESLEEARLHVYRASRGQHTAPGSPARIVRIDANHVDQPETLTEYEPRWTAPARPLAHPRAGP